MSYKPYGDSPKDGKIQVSFTLNVKNDAKGTEIAKALVKKMGLIDPIIASAKAIADDFTYYIIYGSLIHEIDESEIKISEVQTPSLSKEEIEDLIETKIKRDVVFIGASTGFDAHSLGIDAIMNMKGYAGHFGLERYKHIKAYNLGSQVQNEEFIKKAIELKADVLLVSQTVTQKDIHIANLINLVELLEADNLRDKVVLIVGGARITNELAKELGYDAGFGPGKYAIDVATYAIMEIINRMREVKEEK